MIGRRLLGTLTGLAIAWLIPVVSHAQSQARESAAERVRARADSLEAELRRAESELDRLQGAVRRLRVEQEASQAAPDPIEGAGTLSIESLLGLPRAVARDLGRAARAELDRTVETTTEARAAPGQWVPALTQEYADRVFNARKFESLSLDPSVAVLVTHQYGDVLVEPSDGCEAEVWQRLSLRWNGQDLPGVQAYLAALRVAMHSHNDSVLLQMSRPAVRPASIARLRVDLTVRVPTGRAVTVNSQYGDVVIRELEAPVTASAAFGDVDVIGITGPLSVRAQNGDVLVRRHDGPVTLEHTVGSVGIQETSGFVRFSGRFSDAWLSGLESGCNVTARGGSVIATGIEGGLTIDGVRTELDIRGATDALTLTSDQGDVRLEGVEGDGLVDVRNGRLQIAGCEGDLTVSGSRLALRVEDPAGRLRITNRDGDVVIDARQVAQIPDVFANTTRGVIAVYLPSDPSAIVRAIARRGEVFTDMPLLVNKISGQVLAQGKLGLGESSLVLESDGGRVLVYSSDGVSRMTGGTARRRQTGQSATPRVAPLDR